MKQTQAATTLKNTEPQISALSRCIITSMTARGQYRALGQSWCRLLLHLAAIRYVRLLSGEPDARASLAGNIFRGGALFPVGLELDIGGA